MRIAKNKQLLTVSAIIIIGVTLFAVIFIHYNQNIIFTDRVEGQMVIVKIYFGLQTPTSSTDPCDIVHPVFRPILKTSDITRSTIEKLLKGPTEAEIEKGYFTSLNHGIKLNSIAIVDGEARVDFSSKLEEQVGGSCRVLAIRAQITETLKQFPSVNRVTISINGRAEDILQP